MKISPEARATAAAAIQTKNAWPHSMDKEVHLLISEGQADDQPFVQVIQSLINSTLERAASAAYVACAETRHVSLGDKASDAILAMKGDGS